LPRNTVAQQNANGLAATLAEPEKNHWRIGFAKVVEGNVQGVNVRRRELAFERRGRKPPGWAGAFSKQRFSAKIQMMSVAKRVRRAAFSKTLSASANDGRLNGSSNLMPGF